MNDLSEHLEEDAEYLGHIYLLNDKDCWTEEMFVNNRPINFKLDSDAAVSVIGEDIAHSFKIKKSSKNLKGPWDTVERCRLILSTTHVQGICGE